MRPVATYVARSVVCVSVCVFVTRVCFAKTAEPIEIPFGALTRVSPTNHVGWGKDRTNLFAAARGDKLKLAMRSIAKIIWTLDFILCLISIRVLVIIIIIIINVLVQRFNAILLHDCLPAADRTD